MQKFLQKLEGVSQALLDPLSYLTAAGLLLVVGALLTSSPLRQLLPVLNWTPIRLAGGLLYNSMMVIVNNLSIFLCVASPLRAPAPKSRRPHCWPSWLISSS